MNDVVIKVDNLKKIYQLGEYNTGSLAAGVQSRIKRFLGKSENKSDIESDAHFFRQEVRALNGINLEIRKGEALGIIGGNGSGKSTLLKIISRITAPSSGEVGITGRIGSMLEVGTGFNPAMTGRENIYLNGAILGMTTVEIKEKIDQIIEFSECAQFIDTPVKRYSSGMFVKLAFSVAAHLNSEILILDEVLAVGDVKFQTKCLQKMQEISTDESRTILFVSHNMSTIRRLCTRCVVLNEGQKIFDGNTDEAIGIYMGGSRESQLFYNLEKAQRRFDGHGKYIHLLSVEFEQNNDFRYQCGEMILYTLSWSSDVNAENIYLRAELYFNDGMPVGVAESNCLGDVKAGEKRCTRFSFDTTEIADGHYYIIFDLYTKNSDGSFLTYDRPMVEFPFTVEPANQGEISWQPQVWGRIRLHEMQGIEVNHGQSSGK